MLGVLNINQEWNNKELLKYVYLYLIYIYKIFCLRNMQEYNLSATKLLLDKHFKIEHRLLFHQFLTTYSV